MSNISTQEYNKLRDEKTSSYEFRERRQATWQDIYDLYRGKSKTNRLTQRQAVHIPLMKETIKTALSKIDDAPSVVFREKTGDQQKDLYITEEWNSDYNRLNLEIKDIQDKKNVLLFGRSFTKLNWYNNDFDCDILDVYDIHLDPKTDPSDIETARWVRHDNIFRTYKEIMASPRYSKEGKRRLSLFIGTQEGKKMSSYNREVLEERQRRMQDMGVKNYDKLEGADTLLNLSEHFTYTWSNKAQKWVKYLYTMATDEICLLKAPLKRVIGIDSYPFVSWADDIDTMDFWTDGAGDVAQIINKIINIYFSQMVENRTIKNMGMFWYMPKEGYIPPTIEPAQYAMLPAPSVQGQSIDQVIKQVQVPDLDSNRDEIAFLMDLVSRALATTAIERGEGEKKQITLGEVQILAQKSSQRFVSIAKFYRKKWKQLIEKWYEMKNANTPNNSKKNLFKLDSEGKLWNKDVYAKDWKSKAGYDIEIASSAQQEEEKMSAIQRLMLVKNQFPNNQVLQEAMQRSMLEITSLSTETISRILEAEKNMQEQQAQMMQQQNQEEGQLQNNILQGMNELKSLA